MTAHIYQGNPDSATPGAHQTDSAAPPEISKLLHLSTGHISKATADFLDKEEVYIAKHEFGWFVWVDEFVVAGNAPDIWPGDLVACLRFAHQNGCDWLILDRDVPPIEALPQYDW